MPHCILRIGHTQPILPVTLKCSDDNYSKVHDSRRHLGVGTVGSEKIMSDCNEIWSPWENQKDTATPNHDN